ncbi:MAG: glycosyltransferase family 4 protein [Candidatus Desulfaltia sp.]|nr:glycosyltransferase family 4 protein [Candidatus Desulfaltia sp.]
MKRIKVIHIITRLDKGGSAENTLLTVMGLDKERYDVVLVKGLSVESNMAEDEVRTVEKDLAEAEREGVRIITIPDLVRRIHPFYDLKAFFALIKILCHERPDIVHTHTSKAGILGRWAAFLAGIPVIIHTPHGHVFWGYSGRRKTSFYIMLEKITARITDKIVALTQQEKRDHLHFCIATEDKFSVVHSGINLDRFSRMSVDFAAMKRRLGIPEGNMVVGTVGRLTPVKGHKYLIKAAGKIVKTRPDTTFVFLGDGELSDELKKMTFSLGIEENIKFLGWRPDVAEVMSTFDIFALPSLNEGMGRVLVEAMALGKPIVASDIGGIPDLVVDGENGYLVPVGDVETLAARIRRLLDDPGKREEMGNTGQRYALKYSSEEMMKKIDRLYRELAVSCCHFKE